MEKARAPSTQPVELPDKSQQVKGRDHLGSGPFGPGEQSLLTLSGAELGLFHGAMPKLQFPAQAAAPCPNFRSMPKLQLHAQAVTCSSCSSLPKL